MFHVGMCLGLLIGLLVMLTPAENAHFFNRWVELDSVALYLLLCFLCLLARMTVVYNCSLLETDYLHA